MEMRRAPCDPTPTGAPQVKGYPRVTLLLLLGGPSAETLLHLWVLCLCSQSSLRESAGFVSRLSDYHLGRRPVIKVAAVLGQPQRSHLQRVRH